jgi:Tol biopolymer transport system component
MRVQSRFRSSAFLIGASIGFVSSASAQGTAADYARAEGLASRFEGLVVNAPDIPTWIPGTHRFWYRRSGKGGFEFVQVDAETKARTAAFDHARLAASLSTAANSRYTATTLPFSAVTFVENAQRIEFSADSARWRCDLTSYECTRSPTTGGRFGGAGGRGGGFAAGQNDLPRISPDRSHEAFIRNYNVFVRSVGSPNATALSTDGSEGNAYALRSIAWSPDSRRLAAYRVTPGYRRMVRYVASSPEDQIQPKYMERLYLKPGDVLDVEQPVLFDVAADRETVIDNSLFPNAYEMSDPVWRKDGRAFTFEYNQRGHQLYRIIEVDAATGRARSVISEEPKTFFDYRTITANPADHGNKYRFDLDDGKQVIWMSERDGWAHLYLMDGATGAVKNQITRGDWVVRGIDSVDVVHRQIWFRASGMYAGKDP